MLGKIGYGLTLVTVSIAAGGLIGLVFHVVYGIGA